MKPTLWSRSNAEYIGLQIILPNIGFYFGSALHAHRDRVLAPGDGGQRVASGDAAQRGEASLGRRHLWLLHLHLRRGLCVHMKRKKNYKKEKPI